MWHAQSDSPDDSFDVDLTEFVVAMLRQEMQTLFLERLALCEANRAMSERLAAMVEGLLTFGAAADPPEGFEARVMEQIRLSMAADQNDAAEDHRMGREGGRFCRSHG